MRFWAISDGQQAFTVHLVQHRTQRAGADVVAMTRQFLGQPGAVDLLDRGVMQDVQPHRPALKLP
ncbi:MAG: hypothetical protein QOJ56_4, partial [Mycobacterium sp.]|nr:hypothetical protein [Mycobacterium sp.]